MALGLVSARLRNDTRLNGVTSARPLAKGEQGRAVEILQHCLIDLGHPMPKSTSRSGLTDGVFGSETEAVVKAFQRQHGLKPDGMAGPLTLAQLDVLFVARERLEALRHSAEMNSPPPIRRWNAT
jgi:peptidoglycan hydrolase-like protein with peptidoglycan-binding domain